MIRQITNKTVEKYRPQKAEVDHSIPYLYLNEKEVQKDGTVQDVNTIFLTNRECPFKCVMCDLWRHTLDKPTPKGAIPRQIEYALERLPNADVVKLYNSGNFFDGKAIPRYDYEKISDLLSGYDHVIVENHPRLIGSFIPKFRDMLNSSLEIAMGLETIHPKVLPKLNKQITKEDFFEATRFLNQEEIDVRAFILLNPPFLTDPKENIEWCLKSVEFAFDSGCTACSIIPVRDGNGIMEELKKSGDYIPPTLTALETVFERSLQMNNGRVFCDVWDLEKFSDCDVCFEPRKKRLEKMNLSQNVLPGINCDCN
ncbi:radical SAM protein [Rhodohalobacter sp. 614A]|uniref:radical SAM protein n=1 Tax=Rhodohalobacter sp. 614A TaxID=2908649 RepID=UPI001F250D0E|nr:radical SAM protein [Rhodohalobacter sp. 614A]